MSFHLALPRSMQLAQGAEQSARGECPRDAMALLAGVLGAQVHEPIDAPARGLDRLRSKLAPGDPLWAMARHLKAVTGPGDVVFFSSEAGGLQFAAVCDDPDTRPRLALFVHNVDRPKARLAMRLWQFRSRVDLFLACSQRQVEFLRRFLNLPVDRVRHVWDHTDTRFFSPGPMSPGKTRPLVVSVGLEQRDYKTLAAATGDLDVDVRISGFSKDAAVMTLTFPETLPPNMSRRFYTWPELVQLYRDADVVVVSCHENKYAAGVQSLMEASACRRPVIATATEGLVSYLDDSVVRVPPGDAASMRRAITASLADAPGSEERARRSHAVAIERYDMDRYVTEIAGAVRSLV